MDGSIFSREVSNDDHPIICKKGEKNSILGHGVTALKEEKRRLKWMGMNCF